MRSINVHDLNSKWINRYIKKSVKYHMDRKIEKNEINIVKLTTEQI